MNTTKQYDEVGRSSTWKANISTTDHGTKYSFDNGYTVSLLWGKGSYGSMNEFGHATSYEIAVFDSDSEFLYNLLCLNLQATPSSQINQF